MELAIWMMAGLMTIEIHIGITLSRTRQLTVRPRDLNHLFMLLLALRGLILVSIVLAFVV